MDLKSYCDADYGMPYHRSYTSNGEIPKDKRPSLDDTGSMSQLADQVGGRSRFSSGYRGKVRSHDQTANVAAH